MVSRDADRPKHPADRALRNLEKVPVLGSWVRRGLVEFSARGERLMTDSLDRLKALTTAVAVQVVELVLDEIDLTALVLDRVDVNAIAAEFDIDAVLNRVDLIGLANKVIDGVDLPAIIQASTNSVTAEVMSDVRSQSERADDLVAAIVDRALGRSRAQR